MKAIPDCSCQFPQRLLRMPRAATDMQQGKRKEDYLGGDCIGANEAAAHIQSL